MATLTGMVQRHDEMLVQLPPRVAAAENKVTELEERVVATET